MDGEQPPPDHHLGNAYQQSGHHQMMPQSQWPSSMPPMAYPPQYRQNHQMPQPMVQYPYPYVYYVQQPMQMQVQMQRYPQQMIQPARAPHHQFYPQPHHQNSHLHLQPPSALRPAHPILASQEQRHAQTETLKAEDTYSVPPLAKKAFVMEVSGESKASLGAWGPLDSRTLELEIPLEAFSKFNFSQKQKPSFDEIQQYLQDRNIKFIVQLVMIVYKSGVPQLTRRNLQLESPGSTPSRLISRMKKLFDITDITSGDDCVILPLGKVRMPQTERAGRQSSTAPVKPAKSTKNIPGARSLHPVNFEGTPSIVFEVSIRGPSAARGSKVSDETTIAYTSCSYATQVTCQIEGCHRGPPMDRIIVHDRLRLCTMHHMRRIRNRPKDAKLFEALAHLTAPPSSPSSMSNSNESYDEESSPKRPKLERDDESVQETNHEKKHDEEEVQIQSDENKKDLTCPSNSSPSPQSQTSPISSKTPALSAPTSHFVPDVALMKFLQTQEDTNTSS